MSNLYIVTFFFKVPTGYCYLKQENKNLEKSSKLDNENDNLVIKFHFKDINK